MGTQGTSSTCSFPPGSQHGFFKTLPRELRNSIYDELYREVGIRRGNFSLCVTTPCVALRLVNRQAKLEYDERCPSNEHVSHRLLIKDSENFRFLMHAWLEFPAITRHATNVTVVVNACGGDGRSKHGSGYIYDRCRTYYPEYYQDWINHLAKQLPSLRSVRVYLTVPKARCVYTVLPTLSSIAKLPQVSEMNLLPPGCAFVATGENKPLSKWARACGVEQDEAAVDEYLERSSYDQ